MNPTSVVLIGAHGHGRQHLANLRRLTRAGRVRLAGVCDLAPLPVEALQDLGTPVQSADLGDLLATTGPSVVIVCTPIHTHLDLALTAARHGCDLLLEKPPAATLADHQRLADGIRQTGRACQIGFQSLGSHAVPAVRRLVADGAIGEVRGIGAAGAWVRDAAYYARAGWAGRRTLDDGTPVLDGVLTNPLAHAVATALHLDGSPYSEDVARIELELHRARAIEADDTSCLRVHTARGTTVTVAATLCAEQPSEPYLMVHGDRGRITFWYKQDTVLLQRRGHGPLEILYDRTDLLENLLDHRDHGADLLVPPAAAGSFMRVAEAVRTAPDPAPLPAAAVHERDGGRLVVDGVDTLLERSAEQLALFSELGAGWPAATAAREALA
ncbi:Gfo/Idh/MocA family protein [Peterkaempfera sp. SMS 1(5)a]|uniref:Gfo/Idh/MocA family protein n=1 Tax=Peterkaempfera podocarpi TaxID=3232308 RepID=UPI00366B42F4